MKKWLLIGALLLAVPSYAADGVTGMTVSVSARNLTSVAIKAILQGDDDSSAVCRIFQAVGSNQDLDTGMTMIRRTGTNGRWQCLAGSSARSPVA